MIIKTDRLLLRPLVTGDLASTYEYASDKENTAFMLYLHDDEIEQTERFVLKSELEWQKENPSFYEFAVVLDKKHIGAVSIYLSNDRKSAELGWIINKRYWGKGYASESAAAARDFAVNVLGVIRITAHCDCRNMKSYKLMEKIGMTCEDTSGIRTYPKKGETSRELLYSLIIER